MQLSELKKIVSQYSEIDITELNIDNTLEWDSLAHLGIISALSNSLGNEISSITCLSESLNFAKIFHCLDQQGFID